MLASAQAVWYALRASSMAFFCAEEPSALRSPLKQSPAAVEPAAVEPPPGAAALFSDAQADSARAPDRAMAPRALIRETDTSVIPLDGVYLVVVRAGPSDVAGR